VIFKLNSEQPETVVVSSRFSDAIKGFYTIQQIRLRGELQLKYLTG
jgi:hypothetical protein